MRTNLAQHVVAVALGLIATGASYAHEDRSEAGTNHWLSHIMESKTQPSPNQLAPYGFEVSSTAERVADVSSGTRFLNVTRLETVRINVGDKSVVWRFDTLGTAPFSLAKIIPGLDGVTVYVTENPMYLGN